jgi:hypothetical protein
LHFVSIFEQNGVQLGLEFPPKLQLDFPACFLHVANLLFYFLIFILKKSEFLGNNPELSYDSCPPLYNAYDRKSRKRL